MRRHHTRFNNAAYDILNIQLGCDPRGVPVRTFLWMSGLNDGNDISNPGSLPTQALLSTIYASMGTDQSTFFNGQAAWSPSRNIDDYNDRYEPC